MTSRPRDGVKHAERMCYPYRFTWPADPANPATNNFADNQVAIEVLPGDYNYDGGSMTANYDCPPGHQCIFPWMQDWRQCPAGTYSAQTADSIWACAMCPEQKHCPLRGDTATDVATGYYSPNGVHLPLPVRAGWAAGPNVPLAPCKPGYHSDDFAGTCTQCIPGEVCSFRSNRPLPCNEGMESTANGRYTCIPCQINEVFNADPAVQACEAIATGKGARHGMFEGEKCPFGFYSDATSIADAASTDCMRCDDGYTCGSASTTATEAACPAGYWCNSKDENYGAISKYPCPAGYKDSGLTGAARTTMANSCTACLAGNYCEGADYPETTCKAGYFCPAGTRFATQFPCPAGTKSVAGATSISDCTACDSGYFCPPGSGT